MGYGGNGAGNDSGSGGTDWGRIFAALLSGYASYQNAREGQRAAEAAKNPQPSSSIRIPYMNELLSQMIPYILSEAGNMYQHRSGYTGYTPEQSGLARIQQMLAPYVSGERSTNGVGGVGGIGAGAYGYGQLYGEPFKPGQGARDSANGGYVDNPYGGATTPEDLRGGGSVGGGAGFGNEFLDDGGSGRSLTPQEMAHYIVRGGQLGAGMISGAGIYSMAKPLINRIMNRGEQSNKGPGWAKRMEDILAGKLQQYYDNSQYSEALREQDRIDRGVLTGDAGPNPLPSRQMNVDVEAPIRNYMAGIPPEQRAAAFDQLRRNLQMARANRANEALMFSPDSQNAFFGIGGPFSTLIADGGYGGGGGNMRANPGVEGYRFGGTGGGFGAY